MNVSRGVFENHKLIFSFLISCNLLLYNKKLDRGKWELFLKGAGVIDRKKQIPNESEKIDEYQWDILDIL